MRWPLPLEIWKFCVWFQKTKFKIKNKKNYLQTRLFVSGLITQRIIKDAVFVNMDWAKEKKWNHLPSPQLLFLKPAILNGLIITLLSLRLILIRKKLFIKQNDIQRTCISNHLSLWDCKGSGASTYYKFKLSMAPNSLWIISCTKGTSNK